MRDVLRGIVLGIVVFAMGTILYAIYIVHELDSHLPPSVPGGELGIDPLILGPFTYHNPLYWLAFAAVLVICILIEKHSKGSTAPKAKP